MIFTFTASLPAGVLYDVTLKDSYGDSWGFGIELKLDACDGTEINTLTYDEGASFCTTCFNETFQVLRTRRGIYLQLRVYGEHVRQRG